MIATADGQSSLRVEVLLGLSMLESLAVQLNAVNAAAQVPSPFHTVEFLRAYAAHSEFFPQGLKPRLYLVWQEQKLLGWLALREDRDLLYGFWPQQRLDLLATHDNDRPTLVAVAGSEVQVAQALVEYLMRTERWALLELRAQTVGGALHQAAHKAEHRNIWVRDFPIEPYSEVTIKWPTLANYFSCLAKKMRSNISRQARHLFAAGEVEFLLLEGEAVQGIFDAYLQLESRSWKNANASAVARHPKREQFYRAITAGAAGLKPSFVGIILDGVLVAGIINGHFGNRSWCMEMCFDESRADLGPGQLLLLLTMERAIRTGQRSVNFLQQMTYFKNRWLADEISVVNLQFIRRSSLYFAKGLLGDCKRRFMCGIALWTRQVKFNSLKREQLTELTLAHSHSVDESRKLLTDFFAMNLPGVHHLRSREAAALLPFSVLATESYEVHRAWPAGRHSVHMGCAEVEEDMPRQCAG